MPTASPGVPPGRATDSSRMPATLPPFSSTSLGHFTAKGSARPVTATNVSNKASAATNDRNAARTPGCTSGRTSAAAKLPAGFCHARPRRPRPAVCCRAMIQVGAAIAPTRRAASSRVLSTSSSTTRSYPAGHSVTRPGPSSFHKYSRRRRPAAAPWHQGVPVVHHGSGRDQLTSVAAAAAAAPSIPKRLTTPSTIATADAVRNPHRTGDCGRSSASPSSPKYM